MFPRPSRDNSTEASGYLDFGKSNDLNSRQAQRVNSLPYWSDVVPYERGHVVHKMTSSRMDSEYDRSYKSSTESRASKMHHQGSKNQAPVAEIPEEGLCVLLEMEHKSFMSVMQSRRTILEQSHRLLVTRNGNACLKNGLSSGRFDVIADLLTGLCQDPEKWTLDLCLEILPSTKYLFKSPSETYLSVVCLTLKLILKHFGSLIKSVLKQGTLTNWRLERDLAGLERHVKCSACYEEVLLLFQILEKLQNHNLGQLTHKIKEVQFMLEELEFDKIKRKL